MKASQFAIVLVLLLSAASFAEDNDDFLADCGQNQDQAAPSTPRTSRPVPTCPGAPARRKRAHDPADGRGPGAPMARRNLAAAFDAQNNDATETERQRSDAPNAERRRPLSAVAAAAQAAAAAAQAAAAAAMAPVMEWQRNLAVRLPVLPPDEPVANADEEMLPVPYPANPSIVRPRLRLVTTDEIVQILLARVRAHGLRACSEQARAKRPLP